MSENYRVAPPGSWPTHDGERCNRVRRNAEMAPAVKGRYAGRVAEFWTGEASDGDHYPILWPRSFGSVVGARDQHDQIAYVGLEEPRPGMVCVPLTENGVPRPPIEITEEMIHEDRMNLDLGTGSPRLLHKESPAGPTVEEMASREATWLEYEGEGLKPAAVAAILAAHDGDDPEQAAAEEIVREPDRYEEPPSLDERPQVDVFHEDGHDAEQVVLH